MLVGCLKSERSNICLFSSKKVSEIRTICSDFRQFSKSEQIYNRTEVSCLKSERVRISDVYCTVNVRKPDVRIAKPDIKMSGFRTSGYRTSGWYQSVRLSDVYCISNVR